MYVTYMCRIIGKENCIETVLKLLKGNCRLGTLFVDRRIKRCGRVGGTFSKSGDQGPNPGLKSESIGCGEFRGFSRRT
jgi:hypothetical protein